MAINTNPSTPDPQTVAQQAYNPMTWMTAGAIGPNGTDGSAGGSLPAALLTPDALMAYCANRLGSLDSQIQTIFAQQQSASDVIQQIDTVANNVSVAGQNGVLTSSPGQLQALDQQIVDAINKAGGENTPAGKELLGALNTLDPTCKLAQNNPSDPTTLYITQAGTSAIADQVAQAVKGLQNAAQDVNSGSELNMIQLQSLMSERQTAIQITTNLVQSLGQQMNAIATNVGK